MLLLWEEEEGVGGRFSAAPLLDLGVTSLECTEDPLKCAGFEWSSGKRRNDSSITVVSVSRDVGEPGWRCTNRG